jgi:hypothetical protein
VTFASSLGRIGFRYLSNVTLGSALKETRFAATFRVSQDRHLIRDQVARRDFRSPLFIFAPIERPLFLSDSAAFENVPLSASWAMALRLRQKNLERGRQVDRSLPQQPGERSQALCSVEKLLALLRPKTGVVAFALRKQAVRNAQ